MRYFPQIPLIQGDTVLALIVQKFGGSSVGDADKIKHVAKRVIETQKAGNQVVVVVSAMGDTTDELLDLANSVADDPNALVHSFFDTVFWRPATTSGIEYTESKNEAESET